MAAWPGSSTGSRVISPHEGLGGALRGYRAEPVGLSDHPMRGWERGDVTPALTADTCQITP